MYLLVTGFSFWNDKTELKKNWKQQQQKNNNPILSMSNGNQELNSVEFTFSALDCFFGWDCEAHHDVAILRLILAVGFYLWQAICKLHSRKHTKWKVLWWYCHCVMNSVEKNRVFLIGICGDGVLSRGLSGSSVLISCWFLIKRRCINISKTARLNHNIYLYRTSRTNSEM